MRLLPKPQHPLQHRLILILAGHIPRREIHGDPRVRLRVVQLHVNTIEHAGELILAFADDPLQAVGKVGHFQLIGIRGRYSGDGVSAQNGTLEQVHVAVHQQCAVLGPTGIQAKQVPQDIGIIPALVLNIMNGQHGAYRAEALLPHTVIFEVDGHQGSLPVVAVNDLRPKLQMPQHPDDRPGEKREPFTVIHVAIQLRAVKILLIIQKIPRNSVLLQRKQATVAVAPGQVHIVVALKI